MELLRAFDLNEGAREHSEAPRGGQALQPILTQLSLPLFSSQSHSCESLYRNIISFLSGIYLGVEQLNHTVGEY